MITPTGSLLRRRWLALGAAFVLLVVVLTAGTLFAATERRHPEVRPLPHESVDQVTDPGLAPGQQSVPPAPERVSAQMADDQEEEADLPPITKTPPKYPNLDSNLNRLLEQPRTVGAPAAGQHQPSTAGGGSSPAPPAEPVLVTFYIEPEQVAAVEQYLEDNDVFIRNVGEDWIEAHVPPTLLPAASERPGVRRVDTVIAPQPQSLGRVVSQGVALHQADAWHRLGYRGQGVKVGVIDDGYQGFSELQGGELPGNVTARCYFAEARAPSARLADCEQAPCDEIVCNHGTAVAETLVDVAPEVELYIANPISRGDLRDAADWMAGQGVQVVNMSLGWITDGPGDGTSPSSASPLKTIDAAVSGEITWVNAAGNSARNVWYGSFSDPDGNGWHNFTPRVEANAFFLPYDPTSPGRSRVTAFMRWDDSWGGADCDLDLHLLRFIPGPNVYRLIGSADTVQDGGVDATPFAALQVEVTGIGGEGRYSLAISKHVCADPPAWIQLTTWMADDLEYYSPGHHIGSPAESRNPGMLAVAATHWWDIDYIADYSSRGPTMDGRPKPDITGVACARSATLGSSRPGSPCPFGGTSQASPHVAGLAALVTQRFPDFSPAQVTNYLQQNATERGTAGKDNVWGHGFAVLPNPQPSQPAPPPRTDAGSILRTSNVSVRNGANSGEVVVSWDSVPDATYYRIGYVNLEADYPIAKASVSGEWQGAFRFQDVNVRDITVADGRAEYTVRRLARGVRHAFTVQTSQDVFRSGVYWSGRFGWPHQPYWQYLTTAR